ncbi:MAG: VCBS repeat-containing protein [Planctomycetes bacterium]|nr:VCBS repeat-containing protein [Planctomycetota bacterium]
MHDLAASLRHLHPLHYYIHRGFATDFNSSRRYSYCHKPAKKHHDQLFGDFDGDGRAELVFWNQGARKLYIAEIPTDPSTAKSWQSTQIYSWSSDSEIKQRGRYPGFKALNEHEGLAKADIDGDGKLDIVGGGRWFKHNGRANYTPNIIDASYAFSRAATGRNGLWSHHSRLYL